MLFFLKTKLYILIALLSSIHLIGQNYSGSRLYNASNNIELSIQIDGNLNEVTLTMKGPTSVWFAFGFGVNRMTNAYTIVSDGNGNISERKLGNHNAGSLLSNSFTFVNYSTSGDVATTVVKRPLTGMNTNYYSFEKLEQSIPIIWAYGSRANFSSHSRRGISTLPIQQECTATQSNITESSCAPYFAPSGQKYTESGTYQDIISNSAGCDSVITIELTILPNPRKNQSIEACNFYSSPSGRFIWTETGVYTDTLPQANACDSIYEIDLIIIKESRSELRVTACEEYNSPSGKYLYTTSGKYSDTLTSSLGCDSIIDIDLTISSKMITEIFVEECTEYTSPSGKNTYTESGAYPDTLISTLGCDSILLVNLTIINSDTTVIRNGSQLEATATNANFQWLDCQNDFAKILGETSAQFSPSENGVFAVEVNNNGCIDTSSCYAISFIGIESQETPFIKISNSGQTLFVSLKPNSDIKSLELFNATGHKLWHKTKNFEQDLKIELIQKSGFYLLLARHSNGTLSRKKIILGH